MSFSVTVHFEYGNDEVRYDSWENVNTSELIDGWYVLFADNNRTIAEYAPGVIIMTEWHEETDKTEATNISAENLLTDLEQGTTVEDSKPRIPNYSYGFGDLFTALMNNKGLQSGVPAVTNYQTDKKEN